MTDPASPTTPTTPIPADTSPVSRRAAIAAMGVAGATALTAAAQKPRRGAGARPDAEPAPAPPLGWDDATAKYTLPDLPYAYDALEPHIDAQTMRIHHDMHHAGYVKGANNAIDKLAHQRGSSPDASMVEYWSGELTFNVGGHINHALFWSGMAPPSQGGGGEPTGLLQGAIAMSFGSVANFRSLFTAAAKSVEGSGWAWLVLDPISRRLLITQMHNQQKSMFVGAIPMLGIDVWEHAYYLKYQNRRADYIDAWWNVVNWSEIERRYNAAMA